MLPKKIGSNVKTR